MVHIVAPSILQSVRYAHSVGLQRGQFRAVGASMNVEKHFGAYKFDADDMIVMVDIRWDSHTYQYVRQQAALDHVDVFEVRSA